MTCNSLSENFFTPLKYTFLSNKESINLYDFNVFLYIFAEFIKNYPIRIICHIVTGVFCRGSLCNKKRKEPASAGLNFINSFLIRQTGLSAVYWPE